MIRSRAGGQAATIATSYPGGSSLQHCAVTEAKPHVTVTCDVTGNTPSYSADNFELTLIGNVLIGTNIDDAGVSGTVDFCKQ